MDTKLFARVQSGGMFTVLDKSATPGNVFYVDAGHAAASDSAGFGQNPDAPVATIDYAIGLCTASQGDVILVMPGHTETVSNATDFLLDVAGVSVIGLGSGSLIPTITLDTAAAATLGITAADCTLKNLSILSAFTNGVTAGVTLAATATGFTLDGLIFKESLVTQEYLIGISIATDCDDGIIQNCRYYGIASGGTSSIIAAAGGTDRTIIRDNYFHGDASAAALKFDAAASADLQVLRNVVINIDAGAGLGIACHNSGTGMVAWNVVANLKDTVVGLSGTGMAYCENYGSNALGASGIILPAVDV